MVPHERALVRFVNDLLGIDDIVLRLVMLIKPLLLTCGDCDKKTGSMTLEIAETYSKPGDFVNRDPADIELLCPINQSKLCRSNDSREE